MAKIQYERCRPRGKAQELIVRANEVIEEYAQQGFVLTVRQIYYQFVARGWIPNTLQSYGLVDRTLHTGRMGGWIDWSAIEDRSRRVCENTHWVSPEHILTAAANTFQLDSREDQDWYLEVWVEKEALLGVIAPTCERLDVTYLACKGFYSLSAMWRAAQRFLEHEHQSCMVIHLGDHDPSGLDMTRDINDRLEKFGCDFVEVNRIALNMDQIEELKPPPNPAKSSDSRYHAYVQRYGTTSWELDALSPPIIGKLITNAILAGTDKKKRKAILRKEQEQKDQLQQVAENWEDVIDSL